MATRTKIKIGDRIAVHGEITRLTPQEDGRAAMTVDIGVGAMVTLDSMWSNHTLDDLKVDQQVRLEGSVTRINTPENPEWTTATLKLDGYAYPVTILVEYVEKA